MSHAIIPAAGNPRQLDLRPEPAEQITERDAVDPSRVARLFGTLLRDVAALKRRWSPRTLVHRDRAVDGTGTTVYRFPHNFGGRVDWSPVRWTNATGGAALVEHSSTDGNTLALVSYTAGTLTLEIREAG